MVELMSVLVIVGIMAAIAAPRLDLSHYRVESAMQALGSTLLVAQRAAVVKQHDVVVSFDAAARMVHVHEDADNDARVDAGEYVKYRPLDAGVALGRGGAPAFRIGAGPVSFTRVQAGRPAVTFHRNGTASEEGGVYLTSTRAARSGGHAADARVIIVDRATGRPTWYNYTRLTWKRGF
jgi:Tfp pilus assembly protein FimT